MEKEIGKNHEEGKGLFKSSLDNPDRTCASITLVLSKDKKSKGIVIQRYSLWNNPILPVYIYRKTPPPIGIRKIPVWGRRGSF